MKNKFLRVIFFVMTLISKNVFAVDISGQVDAYKTTFEITTGQSLKKILTFIPSKSDFYKVDLINSKNDKKIIGSIQIKSDCVNCSPVSLPKISGIINQDLYYTFYAEAGYNYNINLEFKEASAYSVNVSTLKIGDYSNYNDSITFNAPIEPNIKTEAMLQGDLINKNFSNYGVSYKIGPINLYWTNSNLKVYVAFDFPSALNFFSTSICYNIKDENQCKIKITDHIINSASKWTDKTSLKFTKTNNWYEAQIRVLVTDKLKYGISGKSKLGIQSVTNMKEPSMTLSTESVSNEYNIRTILHEFGHALGLQHEHVNPSLILQKSMVYSYCDSKGMSKEDCDINMFLNNELGTIVYTDYDPYSIMGYDIPRSLVVDQSKCAPPNNTFTVSYCNNNSKTLSTVDLKAMQQAYPLTPFKSTYKVECTTSGTTWNGTRKSCDNSICSNAPKYYGFSNVSSSAYSSSGGNCSVQSNNLISQNLGGNTQLYGQICYRASATSPGGVFNANARGWAKCNIDVTLLPIK